MRYSKLTSSAASFAPKIVPTDNIGRSHVVILLANDNPRFPTFSTRCVGTPISAAHVGHINSLSARPVIVDCNSHVQTARVDYKLHQPIPTKPTHSVGSFDTRGVILLLPVVVGLDCSFPPYPRGGRECSPGSYVVDQHQILVHAVDWASHVQPSYLLSEAGGSFLSCHGTEREREI